MSSITRTSTIFTQDIMNYVNDTIYPAVVDNVTRAVFVFSLLMKRRGTFGGKNMVVDVQIDTQGNGKWFSGMDTLNTNSKSVTAQLVFEPKFYDQPIVFSGTDLSTNDSKATVISYMTAKLEQAQIEAITNVGIAMFGPTSTLDPTYSPKAINGIIEAVDAGTNFANYAGLVRANYPDADPSRSAALGFTGTPSYIGGNHLDNITLTVAYLERLYQACSNGMYRPNVIITTKTLQSKIKTFNNTTNFVQPTTTLRSPGEMGSSAGLTTSIGYTDVVFNGMSVIADPHCPEGMVFMLNLDTFDMLVKDDMPDATPIRFASTIVEWSADKNFKDQATGFFRRANVSPIDQYAFISHLFFAGNIVCKQPKYNGYITRAV